jgi:porin
MSVAENEDGASHSWYGAEIDYHLDSRLGGGNYRVLYTATSADFSDESGTGQEPLAGLILSFDQAVGDIVGVFVRAAWQLTDGAGTYASGYEGGFDFRGRAWGREADNIGIAYGHVHGGNSEIFQSDVVEGYYRWAVNDALALTTDVQWMKDSYPDAQDIRGWIFGIRAVTEF